MSDKPDAQRIIELSTVYFFEGSPPRTIELKDCGLPLKKPLTGAFAALYGYQSKQEGLMAAYSYAEQKGLQFTVIDFVVSLEQRQNPLMMKPDDLPNHDFLSFSRLSKSLAEDLQGLVRDALVARSEDPAKYDLTKPLAVLANRPDLLPSIAELPDWEHLKVIAQPAKVEFSERALNVALVPHRHWSSIQEATCRLNPEIRVTLEAPKQSQASRADDQKPELSASMKLSKPKL